MTMRNVHWIATTVLLTLTGFACSTPTAGRGPTDAGTAPDVAAERLIQAIWKGTQVAVGVGDVHNLLPEETAMVKAAANAKQSELRKCFEEVVRKRGCRTNGIPAPFDAMLMIDSDGFIRETRIVPDKNNMPRECHDAVSCVQDVFGTVQVQGLTRFQGRRQAYTTVTLLTPDESTLGATADGGGDR
jgi:hypothetical protein